MTDATTIRAITDLAREGVQELDPGNIYLVHKSDGTTELIDLVEKYRDLGPARIEGTTQVVDVVSLLTYWDKHHDESSDVFADRERHTITTVLDAHGGIDFQPSWQRHRAVCTLELSDVLKTWQQLDGQLMPQDKFAEFIESMIPFILDPPGADLQEMASKFEATMSASFQSGWKPQSGARVIKYVETVDGTMGEGSVAIPKTIKLALPVWRGITDVLEYQQFDAAIRFKVNHGGPGHLGLGYKLVRPGDVIDDAFAAAVTEVKGHVGRPVMFGAPLR